MSLQFLVIEFSLLDLPGNLRSVACHFFTNNGAHFIGCPREGLLLSLALTQVTEIANRAHYPLSQRLYNPCLPGHFWSQFWVIFGYSNLKFITSDRFVAENASTRKHTDCPEWIKGILKCNTSDSTDSGLESQLLVPFYPV